MISENKNSFEANKSRYNKEWHSFQSIDLEDLFKEIPLIGWQWYLLWMTKWDRHKTYINTIMEWGLSNRKLRDRKRLTCSKTWNRPGLLMKNLADERILSCSMNRESPELICGSFWSRKSVVIILSSTGSHWKEGFEI